MNNRPLRLALISLLGVAVLAAGFLLLRQASPAGLEQLEQRAAEMARSALGGWPSPDVQSRRAIVVHGDWYELAFTAPKYPDDRSDHRGGLDERLVELMDRARSTLDVAAYDFDLANVADAMARATSRGVRVRMVTDSDTLVNTRDQAVQGAFARLTQAGVPIVDDQRSDIMHHKFTVVDGEWVQTGSWNYTDGDTYRLNNHQFIVRSAQLAANYTAEFEKMFVHRTFGPGKSAGVPHPRLEIDGVVVENYFAPRDGVARRLIDTVERQASRTLYFLAFSFTHDALGQAVIGKAQGGLAVQGVFENTGSNTSYSEYRRMKESGLDVYRDGNPWAMHHKVLILDERVVVFGSFNFSNNADQDNDENVLVVADASLGQAFKAEYDRVLNLARQPIRR